MQIIISARAQIDRLNKWEADLNRKHVSYTYGKIHGEISEKLKETNKDVQGDSLVGLWQLGLRPIRFYQVAFPEPMTQRVLSMIAPSQPWNKSMDKFLWPMRKIMGLDKIPDWKPQVKKDLKHPTEFLAKDSVECVGVGIRKDRYENGIEQI